MNHRAYCGGMIKVAFGTSLRQRRKARRLTQEHLASLSGVSVRYVQLLEAGERLPTIGTVFQLSAALDTSPQALLKPAWQKWRNSQ